MHFHVPLGKYIKIRSVSINSVRVKQKVKVVINTDPEAPFFKAADYGIVGDAFQVVPKLIDKLKEFKLAND